MGARRRRHHAARPLAEPQPQHQIVPRRLAAPPFRQLVAPGGMMFGPAQFLARLGRIERRDRAAGKDQLAPPDHPSPPLAMARHRQQPARPPAHHPNPPTAWAGRSVAERLASGGRRYLKNTNMSNY